VYLAFDTETGGLHDDILRERLPAFEPPPAPGVFDPAAVKCGNIGGPTSEKGKAKIEEARKAHEELVKRYAADLAAAKEKHFADFKSRAALDATTGRVVAIGFYRADQMDSPDIIDCDQDEETGLRKWWASVEKAIHDHLPLMGFNVCHFDLPFLIRRSWLLGVPIPTGLRKGRYWSDLIVDLMQVWGFHGRDLIGLDKLAKAFDLAGKVTEAGGVDVSGAEFARLWRENRTSTRT
jgi:hypothetical protein